MVFSSPCTVVGYISARPYSFLTLSLAIQNLGAFDFSLCWLLLFRCFASLLKFHPAMAPKIDRPKLPPTTDLGPSAVTEGLIANMVSYGMLTDGAGKPPSER